MGHLLSNSENGLKRDIVTVTYRRNGGGTFNGETRASLIVDEDDEAIGYLALVLDLSSDLAAYRRAEIAERRLQDAVDSLPEGFAIFEFIARWRDYLSLLQCAPCFAFPF